MGRTKYQSFGSCINAVRSKYKGVPERFDEAMEVAIKAGLGYAVGSALIELRAIKDTDIGEDNLEHVEEAIFYLCVGLSTLHESRRLAEEIASTPVFIDMIGDSSIKS